jgi:hypothetical protein
MPRRTVMSRQMQAPCHGRAFNSALQAVARITDPLPECRHDPASTVQQPLSLSRETKHIRPAVNRNEARAQVGNCCCLVLRQSWRSGDAGRPKCHMRRRAAPCAGAASPTQHSGEPISLPASWRISPHRASPVAAAPLAYARWRPARRWRDRQNASSPGRFPPTSAPQRSAWR